jgi:hypothetical protein
MGEKHRDIFLHEFKRLREFQNQIACARKNDRYRRNNFGSSSFIKRNFKLVRNYNDGNGPKMAVLKLTVMTMAEFTMIVTNDKKEINIFLTTARYPGGIRSNNP